MSPTDGYSGHYGSMPADRDFLRMDGTVAPYGALGFLVFTPKQSLAAFEYMRTIPELTGTYGLYDAYSFQTKATKRSALGREVISCNRQGHCRLDV